MVIVQRQRIPVKIHFRNDKHNALFRIQFIFSIYCFTWLCVDKPIKNYASLSRFYLPLRYVYSALYLVAISKAPFIFSVSTSIIFSWDKLYRKEQSAPVYPIPNLPLGYRVTWKRSHWIRAIIIRFSSQNSTTKQ